MNQNILDVTIAPECPHKNCGQVFNESNLRLAIYLNGIFFLVKPEKGIIGFTCPRCQKTVTNSASYNDILKIKDILSNSLVEIESYSESEDGKMLVNPNSSFDASLKYLSPFMLSSKIMKELKIRYLGLNYNKDIPASIEIERYIEKEELKDRYCSFIDDENNPISTFRTVYLFDENNIGNCLNYEAEHHVRIFPRYHYRTDLVKQIHSLLGINYFMGKTFEQAKVDHEKENEQLIENLTTYAREHNLNVEKLLEDNNINEPFALINIIEQNESRIANDPIIPAQFLKVLTSGPAPLGNLLTADICNYLWAEINPFENRPFPEFFVDEIDDPDLGGKIHKKNEEHITMAKLVQENSNKQYVQDFLKNRLISFLSQYEELIQSNQFSYADVWKLKNNYLVDLYKIVNKGLRDDVPYAMYREGEGWKIVYNGESVSGLRGKGFQWIYYIISNPKNKVYYRDLHEWAEGNKNQNEEEAFDEDELEGVLKADQLSVSDDSVLVNKNAVQKENLQTYSNLYEKLYLEKEQAVSEGKSVKVERKVNEISLFLTHLKENNIDYECDGPKLKFTSKPTPETKNFTEAKKTIEKKDHTGTKYKIINDKIKKNYRDALTKLKGIRNAKALHAHLLSSIRKEGGAFIYEPTEDIVWHIN